MMFSNEMDFAAVYVGQPLLMELSWRLTILFLFPKVEKALWIICKLYAKGVIEENEIKYNFCSVSYF